MPLPAHSLPPGGWVELSGRGRTWVWDTGGGAEPAGAPILLLLHGWTSTAALNWCACFAPLAAHTRVVAPDHRGHGRGIAHGPYTVETFADDAAALLTTLDAGPAVVAGYSMGGPVAQLLWRRHPGLVRGLVLAATGATFGSALPPAAVRAVTTGVVLGLAAVPAAWRVQGFRRMVANRYPETAEWARLERQGGRDPLPLLRAAASVATFDSTPWIGGLDRPATVIVTTEDRTVEPERQRALAAAIPGSRLLEVAGDHRACVGRPARFVPALLEGYRHASDDGG